MSVIGIDESGKGDFFGPLVIAAFACSEDQTDRLLGLGVRDSKRLSDGRALDIADSLTAGFPHALVLIGPEKYNALYKKIRNLNKLLAWGHARAIENLLAECPAERAVSDKFADTGVLERSLMKEGKKIRLEQLVKGERILQVAAASILARAAFVRNLRSLSARFKMDIPKGAGAPVDVAGRKLVERYGPDVLDQVAKIHFKNYQRVTALI